MKHAQIPHYKFVYLSEKSTTLVTIRAGSSNANEGGQEIPWDVFTLHDNFNADDKNYDFAIVELDGEIEFDDTKQPIALPEADADVADGEILTVSGWGTTDGKEQYPDSLQAVSVPKANQDACIEAYKEIGPVTDKMICAGPMEGGKDSCEGDGGGALITSAKVIVGLVSWGNECAMANYPGVYARVASVVPWIKSIIEQE